MTNEKQKKRTKASSNSKSANSISFDDFLVDNSDGMGQCGGWD
jgi:hypothetical protein